jgi:hypothetical protein
LLKLGLPVFFLAIAYGVYNYARFDSPFEFGTRYQVTLQRFTTHGKYFIPNIYSYLFAPVKWSCRFPFVEGLEYRPLSSLIVWPQGYLTFEKVAGVLAMGGFCWVQFLLPLWGLEGFLRRVRGASIQHPLSMPFVYKWALACAIGLILSLVPALGLWEASMRYSGDAIGGMVIASAIAAFLLIRRCDEGCVPALQKTARMLIIVLGLHSCFVGAFTGCASYGNPIKRLNPTLHQKLSNTLSVCGLLK